MTRIEWLTHEHFAPLVGQDVEVDAGAAGTLTMRLAEATASEVPGGPGPDGQQRVQFSLVFLGPHDAPLPQATYVVTHQAVGEQEIFLVPIGRDADGVRYEAAFA
ncbi:hypothetical protein L2K70_03730 [Nocardioides KLBMP 9356]|uniref:DUF6916 domain-containing protein n=1 Tax=Nocardioides potassii TaxID=2911371 RepID=A0ABS9H895_9ACTN|nr:hypothetical protein [Nocardioides potassii]MCF6376704.1 hypothetical protein [Nocardioides potassii]